MQVVVITPEATRLALELSRATGETPSDAVSAAVKERLARVAVPAGADDALVADLLAIGRRSAAKLVAPIRAVDAGEILHDQFGLPR